MISKKVKECPTCKSKKFDSTQGSIVEGVVVEHRDGSPYLVCKKCGEIIDPFSGKKIDTSLYSSSY